jgi:hypothetical protein
MDLSQCTVGLALWFAILAEQLTKARVWQMAGQAGQKTQWQVAEMAVVGRRQADASSNLKLKPHPHGSERPYRPLTTPCTTQGRAAVFMYGGCVLLTHSFSQIVC